MDEKNREKLIDIVIMVIMGIMVTLPLGLRLIAEFYGNQVTLIGKSDFSPWMDRLLLLGTAFWVMYFWSFMIPEVKNRAPKVFGCTALFAILSIAIIQLDTLQVPANAPTEWKEAANIWFFNLPYYVVRLIDNNVSFNGMAYLVMGLMGGASVGLLWWIKTELAGAWGKAVKIWLAFEFSYFIIVWLLYRLFGPVLFIPKTSL